MNKLQKYLLALFNIHEFMHIGLKGQREKSMIFLTGL